VPNYECYIAAVSAAARTHSRAYWNPWSCQKP